MASVQLATSTDDDDDSNDEDDATSSNSSSRSTTNNNNDNAMAQTTTMQQEKSTATVNAAPGTSATTTSSGGGSSAFQLFKDSPKVTSLASLPPTTLAAAARALHPGSGVVVPSHMNPFAVGATTAAGATTTTTAATAAAASAPNLVGTAGPFGSAAAALPFLHPHHHPAAGTSLADLALMQQRMALDVAQQQEQARLRYMAQMAIMANRMGQPAQQQQQQQPQQQRGNFFGLGMMQQQHQQVAALQQHHQQQQQHQAVTIQQQQQATALHQKRRLMEAQQLLQQHHHQQQQQSITPGPKRRKLSSQLPYRTSLLIQQHQPRQQQQSIGVRDKKSFYLKKGSFPLPPIHERRSGEDRTTAKRLYPVIAPLKGYLDLWDRFVVMAKKQAVSGRTTTGEVEHAFVRHHFAQALERPYSATLLQNKEEPGSTAMLTTPNTRKHNNKNAKDNKRKNYSEDEHDEEDNDETEEEEELRGDEEDDNDYNDTDDEGDGTLTS